MWCLFDLSINFVLTYTYTNIQQVHSESRYEGNPHNDWILLGALITPQQFQTLKSNENKQTLASPSTKFFFKAYYLMKRGVKIVLNILLHTSKLYLIRFLYVFYIFRQLLLRAQQAEMRGSMTETTAYCLVIVGHLHVIAELSCFIVASFIVKSAYAYCVCMWSAQLLFVILGSWLVYILQLLCIAVVF